MTEERTITIIIMKTERRRVTEEGKNVCKNWYFVTKLMYLSSKRYALEQPLFAIRRATSAGWLSNPLIRIMFYANKICMCLYILIIQKGRTRNNLWHFTLGMHSCTLKRTFDLEFPRASIRITPKKVPRAHLLPIYYLN